MDGITSDGITSSTKQYTDENIPKMITNHRSKIGVTIVRKYDLPQVESDIIINKNESDINIFNEDKVCLVCTNKKSKYSCPNCFIPYCSSICYKKHNIECTESFCRDRVKDITSYEDEITKIRIEEIDNDDNVDNNNNNNHNIYNNEYNNKFINDNNKYNSYNNTTSPEIEEIMDKLETSGLNFDVLNINEKELLYNAAGGHRALSKMNKHITPWNPWWLCNNNNDNKGQNETLFTLNKMDIKYKNDSKITTSINNNNNNSNPLILSMQTFKSSCPSITSVLCIPVPSTSTIYYQLLGLLLGYITSVRSLNGEWIQYINQTNEINEGIIQVINNEEEEGEERSNNNNCNNNEAKQKSIELLWTSTPVLMASFKPNSIAETVEKWLYYQRTTTKYTKNEIALIMLDLSKIIQYRELIFYAIMQCLVVSLLNLNIITEEFALKLFNNNNNNNNNNPSLSSIHAIELIEIYLPIFKKPMNSKMKYNINLNKEEIKASELLARKSFFLILSFFDELQINEANNQYIELIEYINAYLK
jgi:hypothetical protein